MSLHGSSTIQPSTKIKKLNAVLIEIRSLGELSFRLNPRGGTSDGFR